MEAIDREYAELCTKFGDASQKLQHLQSQETLAEAKLAEEAEKVRLMFAEARGTLEAEIRKIRSRWKELQLEAQSTVPNS